MDISRYGSGEENQRVLCISPSVRFRKVFTVNWRRLFDNSRSGCIADNNERIHSIGFIWVTCSGQLLSSWLCGRLCLFMALCFFPWSVGFISGIANRKGYFSDYAHFYHWFCSGCSAAASKWPSIKTCHHTLYWRKDALSIELLDGNFRGKQLFSCIMSRIPLCPWS